MGATKEKKVHIQKGWTDVTHLHAGGGDKQRSERKLMEEAKRERTLLEEGDYCLVIKPAVNYDVGEARKVVQDAYFAQVTHYYPNLMEIRKFERGRAVRGRNGIVRLPLVDVRKSSEFVIQRLDYIPEISIDDSLDLDTLKNVVLSYISILPKKESEQDVEIPVEVGDYCLVNEVVCEEPFRRDCYVAEVVGKHDNLVSVREFRHGSTVHGKLHSILRDELTRGIVKLFRLKMKPEENFTKEMMKIENFREEKGNYLADE